MLVKVTVPHPLTRDCWGPPQPRGGLELPGDSRAQRRSEAAAPPEPLLRGWLEGELLPTTVSALFLPPSLCRKGPVEAKSESQETETKPVPAEAKTVPNDATQTQENEGKA